MRSWLSLASNLRRRTSLIWRMAFLLVGILGSEKIAENNPQQLKTSTQQAFLPFDRDRRFRDRDRQFRAKPEIGHDQTELPVTIKRKRRSRSSGNHGHDGPEYAVVFHDRIPRSSGIKLSGALGGVRGPSAYRRQCLPKSPDSPGALCIWQWLCQHTATKK